jgi:ASC-1-like (ASCH) protein
MEHVAIMRPSWGLIPKILSGKKTVESRWYLTRRAPWDRIHAGDTVYFKNTGEPVCARATVASVQQRVLKNIRDIQDVVDVYGDAVCMINRAITTWERIPQYVILVFLSHPEPVDPFFVDKTGFGSAAAWITTPLVTRLRIDPPHQAD